MIRSLLSKGLSDMRFKCLCIVEVVIDQGAPHCLRERNLSLKGGTAYSYSYSKAERQMMRIKRGAAAANSKKN